MVFNIGGIGHQNFGNYNRGSIFGGGHNHSHGHSNTNIFNILGGRGAQSYGYGSSPYSTHSLFGNQGSYGGYGGGGYARNNNIFGYLITGALGFLAGNLFSRNRGSQVQNGNQQPYPPQPKPQVVARPTITPPNGTVIPVRKDADGANGN